MLLPSRSSLLFVGALSLSLLSAGCNSKPPRPTAPPPASALAADPDEDPPEQLYWPGWRGLNTSGIAKGREKLLAQWNLATDVRWKTPLPGRGNSSPVICGNHVLLTAALGEEAGSQLVVLSLDRRDGGLRWQTVVGKARGGTHAKNGFASASCVTDGKQVFASFGSAGLFAFDLATGQEQWRAELGELEHEWGGASSPVLWEGLVIQLADAATGSSIAAFDKATGERRWRTERESYGSWSTPVLVDATDAAGMPRQEFVVNGTGTKENGGGWVIAYDPAGGRELWRAQGTTEVVCPSAIVGGGQNSEVISNSGRNGPVFSIRPGGRGDVTKSNVNWQLPRGGAYVPTGIQYRHELFLLADGGVISCLDLRTGETEWRDRLQGNFTASLVAGDDKIFAANEAGTVYVVDAGETFNLLATNELDDKILATPAIARGQIFVRTETTMYCVGRAE